jgi:hypothetical protein
VRNRVGLLFAFAGLAIVMPISAYANPCAMDYLAGRHVLAGAPQKDVFIVDETIQFRAQRSSLDQMVVEISVAYTFVNRGSVHTVVMGFPVGHANLSSFRVQGDGVGARLLPDAEEQTRWLEQAALAPCEREQVGQSPTAGSYDWYLWRQSLAVGESRIEVRYVQRWPSSGDALNISYVLRTARFWGDGRIRRLRIELVDPGLGHKQRWKPDLPPSRVLAGGRRLVWDLKSHAPKRDWVLRLQQRDEDGQWQ